VWLGVRAVTTPYGVEVMDVTPETWADRIGLRAGDILLTVSGAPLFDTRDLGTVQRILHSNDIARGTWARNGERLDATAPV
jgi:S1-C subfamily serine protease